MLIVSSKEIMKKIKKGSLLIVLSIGFFTSCSDISKKVEDRLIELDTKTEQLDSIVNREIDRVMELDTLINYENIKVEKLDSLIEKNASKIDSIAKEKIRLLKEIAN